jgi:hypothetical protein
MLYGQFVGNWEAEAQWLLQRKFDGDELVRILACFTDCPLFPPL